MTCPALLRKLVLSVSYAAAACLQLRVVFAVGALLHDWAVQLCVAAHFEVLCHAILSSSNNCAQGAEQTCAIGNKAAEKLRVEYT